MSYTVRLIQSLLCCLILFNTGVMATDIAYITSQHEPYSMKSTSGQSGHGFVGDLLNEILKDSPYQTKGYKVSQKRKLHLFMSDQFPLWISYSSLQHYTNKYDSHYKNASISTPFHKIQCVSISKQKTDYTKLENFDNKTIVTSLGANKEAWSEVLGTKNINIIAAKNAISGIKVLLHDRADVMLSMKLSAQWSIQNTNAGSQNLHIQNCSFWPEDQFVFIMNTKTAELLLPLFNRRIEQLTNDGTVQKLLDQYTQ